ncbi:hypothetical protein EJD97_016074 [Solanum chilense]|uniref:FAF domain-containing protein n=1 Tax=Solanum chilense TaxID=4083 RepID=A0A6N2B5U4_SOLCI|nr:hypothetical protein EJD97_016074 [Solanum chilense]
MSCTESLGLESFDERTINDDNKKNIENLNNHGVKSSTSFPNCKKTISVEKKENKSFPPPLSSLNQDGKPIFSLKPTRKDGKLELNEVKMDIPSSIVVTSRQQGRLRLNLIPEQEGEDNDNDNDNDNNNDDDEDVVM